MAASSVARVADKQRREQQELLEILGILYGFASNLRHQHSSVRTVTAPVLSSLSMSGTSKSVIPFLSTGGSLTVSWSVTFASVQHFLLWLHSMFNNVQSANFKQLSAFFVNFQSILTRPEGIRQKTEALGHARRNFSPKSCRRMKQRIEAFQGRPGQPDHRVQRRSLSSRIADLTTFDRRATLDRTRLDQTLERSESQKLD